jgi:ABC-type sugar transport system substrate-binding protein
MPAPAGIFISGMNKETPVITRRALLASSAAAALLVACATTPAQAELPPIVLVHGNGDSRFSNEVASFSANEP